MTSGVGRTALNYLKYKRYGDQSFRHCALAHYEGKIGLKYYDGMLLHSFSELSAYNVLDINSRIPRMEVYEIFKVIKKIGELALGHI